MTTHHMNKSTLTDVLSPHAQAAQELAVWQHEEERAYLDTLPRWWGEYRWHLFIRLSADTASQRLLSSLIHELLEHMGVYAVIVYQRRPYLHAHLLVGHQGWRGVCDGLHLRLQVTRWNAQWARTCRSKKRSGEVWLDRFRPHRRFDGRHLRGVRYITRDVRREGDDDWELFGHLRKARHRRHQRTKTGDIG